MFEQVSQSRTWPKIFAARGDGPGKGMSPIYGIPSRHDISFRESEHETAGKPHKEFSPKIEEMFKETVSQQGFTFQKTGKLKQAIKNDEEALAGAMKEISNEVESFHTLFNNQWFNNKSKVKDVLKQLHHSTKGNELANILEPNEVPRKVGSNNDIQVPKNIPISNKSSLRGVAKEGSKIKLRELENELSNLNLSQKIVSPSPSHSEYVTNENQVQKMAGYTTTAAVRPVNAHADFERQDYKMDIGVMTTKATQVENLETVSPNNITQVQTSLEAYRSQHNEFTERQAKVDDSANALTYAERQTFKEALNAMNAETEREEKRAAKVSSKSMAARRSGLLRTSKEHRRSAGAVEKAHVWSSSSIATVDVKKYNRQSASSAEKLVHSQSAINKPQHVRRVSDVRLEKQKQGTSEPLVKREMTEKQKAAIYHGFPYIKPKSLTSISNVKNGNFQAGFVKAVPLETGVLRVSPSAPLVSKHYATKNMPPTTSQSKFQRRSTQVK